MQMAQEARGITVVHRLLARFVGGVCRFPKLVLTVALVFVGLSVWAAATRLEYHTQRGDLIGDKDCEKRWRRYVAEFGRDDDMVVVVRGGGRDRMIEALEEVARRIAEKPDLFDRLFYKVDLRHLGHRALLLAPAEQVRQIHAGLAPMRPLLELGPEGWRFFTLRSLLETAQVKAALLEPGRPLEAGDEQFFRQLLAISRSADAALADPAGYRSPWTALAPPQPDGREEMLSRPQYFFSDDGTLAFLLVRPVQEEGSFTAARASVEGLRAVLAEVRPGFPDLELGLTGLPVLENDEMVASQRDTELASWLALAGVAGLYFVVFRGFYYPLLTVGTLVVGITWAMGWLTLTVGHLNILSATFAVMLIAMGDYGVLWVTRYEQARRCGMEVGEALRHTATHVAVGNITAATALALAFFAATFADFQAVAELGWVAGCGVLLCALACFTVLPAVLTLADRRRPPVAIPITAAAAWLPRLSARPRLVIGTAVILTSCLAFFAARVTYDHNLLHLQDPELDAVKWEHILIAHTNGASWHALSYADTPEQALALKARFEALPEVSRVAEVASLVPPDQGPKLALLQDISNRLDDLPPRGVPIPHVPPDLKQLQTLLGRLTRRLQTLTTAADNPLLGELRESAEALQARLTATSDAAATAGRLKEFEERMTGDLAEDLHRLRDVSTPAPVTLDDLPPPLRERFVGRSGKWLLRVFARDCLWDYEPLEHFTERVRTVDPEATGKPFGTVEGLRSLRYGFLRAGGYALAVIVLVLLADFRNVRHVLVAVAPLVLGLLLSLGVAGLCGLSINPANLIALPLILGVGVDNGVHVLHDYLLRRAEGWSTISVAIGRGVVVKALSTMIGFGTLMVSSHRGLFGLGFILTLGVGCCMLTAVVFLSAVLRLMAERQKCRNQVVAVPQPAKAA